MTYRCRLEKQYNGLVRREQEKSGPNLAESKKGRRKAARERRQVSVYSVVELVPSVDIHLVSTCHHSRKWTLSVTALDRCVSILFCGSAGFSQRVIVIKSEQWNWFSLAVRCKGVNFKCFKNLL